MTIQLTELQYKVLKLLAEGKSNHTIAKETTRQVGHIRKVVRRLYEKFGSEGTLESQRVMLDIRHRRGD